MTTENVFWYKNIKSICTNVCKLKIFREMPRRSPGGMSRKSLDNLFNHTHRTVQKHFCGLMNASDTFQYFIIKIKAKFTSSVRKNVVKLSLDEAEKKQDGSGSKSDFILKTLSGEYFVRASFFMARHVLLTSSFFCMR